MKRLISLVLSALLVFSLSACGAAPKQTDAEKKPAGEKTKLVVWSYYSGNEQKAFEAMCKKFSESQDKIEVVHEYIPFSDLKKQLSVGIAAGKLPDIAVIDNPDHAAFAAMGMFEDITDKINSWSEKDNYFEGPWKSTIYNSKNYGVPLDSNCLALFYNIEMFEKAGLKAPETWDELRDVAKKLTKPGVYGIGVAAPKSEEGTFHFLPWFLSTGAQVEKLDSPEAVKSLNMWVNLIKDGSMSKEVINLGPGDLEKQFVTGKLAMMVNGPWQMPTIKEDNPDLKWGVVKVPKDAKFASVLGGENMGIVKGKNVDASWEFMKFLCSKDNVQEFISQTGYFPPRKDVAADKFWTEDPLKKVFMEQMQYAMPRGPHPKWPEISNAISTAIQEALTSSKTPEAALKDAQVKIENIVK